MAWARRAGATRTLTASAPGASWNMGNLGATPSMGDRIIAVIDLSMVSAQPTVTGVTDASGLRWVPDFVLRVFHNGYFEELSVWSAVSKTGAAVTSITAALNPPLSAACGCSCAIGAYSGLAVGLGLAIDQNGIQDLISSGFADTVSNATYDSKATLIAPNKPNQLAIGAHGDGGANTTLTAGSGFSVFTKSDLSANGQCVLQDKDSGAAGTPQQSTMTTSGTGFDMSAVLIYRLLAGNTQGMARRPATTRPGRPYPNSRKMRS